MACHLLQRLNTDPRGLFRRIGMMRAGKQLDRLARTFDAMSTVAPEAGRDDPGRGEGPNADA